MKHMQVVSDAHADDGALIALMDGESYGQGIASHVERCATCAERLRELTRRSARISSELALLDGPVPDMPAIRRLREQRVVALPQRSWPRQLLRAAGVLLLIGGAAVAMPGLRDLVRRASTAEPPSERASAPARDATNGEPARSAAPGTLVAFVPSSATLVVRVASTQASGILELAPNDERRVTAQVTAHGDGEELVVLPAELQILNHGDSRADYRVAVPVAMPVTLIVAGDTVFRGAAAGGRRVPLQR
jgi:hypothetical protein